jgi:hypothetical protein
MASIFSGPPKPKAPPKPASNTDADVQMAEANKRKGFRNAGRSGTILTSPTGVAQPAATASKTLLGA